MRKITGQYINGRPYSVIVSDEDYQDYLVTRQNAADNGSGLDLTSLAETSIEDLSDVPSVTSLGLRRALRFFNKATEVQTAINASNNPDLQDAWEYLTTFNANHYLVKGLAIGLNIDDAGIRAIFSKAKELETL